LDPRMRLGDRLLPAPRTTHPTQLQHLAGLKLPNPPADRLLIDPRCPRDRSYPTTPRRARLRRSPQPAPSFIQHPTAAQQPNPLGDRGLIDHTDQFYITPRTPLL